MASILVIDDEPVICPLLRTASTSTGASLPLSSCRMAPTSITRWSKTAGYGGIGSMRRGMSSSKDWRGKHERGGKGCGLIRNPCRRGRDERGQNGSRNENYK